MRQRPMTCAIVAILVMLAACRAVDAENEPGSQQAVAKAIDDVIQKRLDAKGLKPSPQTDDDEFLRRVSLDIIGRIPTAERAASFLNSTDPDKRRKLVDELLADSRYGEYVASRWGDWIDATGSPPRSMASKFREWLAAELNRGRRWDAIVREMLTEGSGPAGYFVWANYKQPGELADTTSRFFLGVQIQCARCHNHPFTSWKQADYWGLAAFYSRLNRRRVKGKGNVLSEDPLPGKKERRRAVKGAAIEIPSSGTRSGAGTLVKAKFLGSSEPELPDEGALRPALAAWITAKDNPYFAKAAVNRVWAHYFGRGLVKLTDGFDAGTEPTHPRLLQLLAREFVRSGYDLKHLIRCLCASQTYQRTSRPLPGNKDDETLYSHMPVRVLRADVLFDSIVTAMGNPKLRGGFAAPLPYEIYSGRKRSSRVVTRAAFVEFFGKRDASGKSTVYTYGIPQVLALMNAKHFNGTPPTVETLVKSKLGRKPAIQKLFLATLTRFPTEAETQLMSGYLSRRNDARSGYTGILWILFNTNEFTLNH